MAAQKIPLVTPAEYLAMERDALEKHEYIAGEVFAMAGARPPHNRISTNISTAFDVRLPDASDCAPFNSDQRVRISDAGPFFYPDVSVACDPVFDDDDCLLNPMVIVEVLSPSTSGYDRGEKWTHYQKIPSLRAFVLVWQTRAHVEIFERTAPGSPWIYRNVADPTQTLDLPCLGIAIPVSELYRRIVFETPAA